MYCKRQKTWKSELYEVKQPDEGAEESIQQWFSRVGSHAIPPTACHLVLLNTYFSASENLHSNFNLIEVTILEENGTKLSGFEKAYYAVHPIQEWLEGIVLRKVDRSTSCQLCEVERQIRYCRTTCTDTVFDVLYLKWYQFVFWCNDSAVCDISI
jgi:hypothetical protein